VRVTPSNPSVTGEARSSGFFSIAQTASVERFDYSFGEDGIRFDWQTDPGLGDQGWSAYRLYRIDASGSEERVGPDRITANELLVADWRRGETYALRAVDGLGGEHELGRVVIPAGAPGIRAWPSPSDERSDVQLAMFPPIQAGGRTPADFSVRIYDLSGREVRILALGSSPTRVGEVSLSWDRTGSRGVEAGPGVYFVRAEVPSTGWREQRRIVLLR
jgi:hypothetical protein